MLDLSRVTLVIVATRGHAISRIAVRDCLRRAIFGDVLVYTNDETRFGDSREIGASHDVRYLPVPDWPNKEKAGYFYYSEAMAKVETEFGLLIEWDGGIHDPAKWRQDFFEYDYVGAPWVTRPGDELKVGNGGFTLVSRRLGHYICENRGRLPCLTDFDVCRRHRPKLEQEGGFRWAPADVAADFSWELGPRSPNNFGYHGTFTWPTMVDRSDLIVRARAMTDDPYVASKMAPLMRVAPWLQSEIGADALSRYRAAQVPVRPTPGSVNRITGRGNSAMRPRPPRYPGSI